MLTHQGPVSKEEETTIKTKKTKKATAAAAPEIICGDLSNIGETFRDLDPTMKVVWTSVGFWACPKP